MLTCCICVSVVECTWDEFESTHRLGQSMCIGFWIAVIGIFGARLYFTSLRRISSNSDGPTLDPLRTRRTRRSRVESLRRRQTRDRLRRMKRTVERNKWTCRKTTTVKRWNRVNEMEYGGCTGTDKMENGGVSLSPRFSLPSQRAIAVAGCLMSAALEPTSFCGHEVCPTQLVGRCILASNHDRSRCPCSSTRYLHFDFTLLLMMRECNDIV